VAAVQAVALYGAELWWRGQKDRQRELQLLINQQARQITGAFRTTPVGPLLKEAGLEPAETTLESTQSRQLGYTIRLLGLPRIAEKAGKEYTPDHVQGRGQTCA
jgi:hypothetical protein